MEPNKPTVLNGIPIEPLPKKGGKPIPLNQPFPKELGNTPIVSIAEHVGQQVVGKEVEQKPALNTSTTPPAPEPSQSSTLPPESEDKKSEENTKSGDKTKDVADHDPLELLKSPEPKLNKSDSKKGARSPIVMTIVGIGVILALIGLIFAITFNKYSGFLLMVIGSTAIIACVFLPIGANKK